MVNTEITEPVEAELQELYLTKEEVLKLRQKLAKDYAEGKSKIIRDILEDIAKRIANLQEEEEEIIEDLQNKADGKGASIKWLISTGEMRADMLEGTCEDGADYCPSYYFIRDIQELIDYLVDNKKMQKIYKGIQKEYSSL